MANNTPKATSSTTAPDQGTDAAAEQTASQAAEAKKPTGRATRDEDRKELPNGKPNKSPSGDLPVEQEQEAGVKPLKAVHQITYGNNQVAEPGTLFIPISQTEHDELLKGEFPPAEKPTKAELALFANEQTDFA